MKNGTRYKFSYTQWGEQLRWHTKYFACLDNANKFKDSTIKRYGNKNIRWSLAKETTTSEILQEGGKNEYGSN